MALPRTKLLNSRITDDELVQAMQGLVGKVAKTERKLLASLFGSNDFKQFELSLRNISRKIFITLENVHHVAPYLKRESTPSSYLAYLDATNNLSYLVVREIVSYSSDTHALLAVKRWAKVMINSYNEKDFFTANYILCGLTTAFTFTKLNKAFKKDSPELDAKLVEFESRFVELQRIFTEYQVMLKNNDTFIPVLAPLSKILDLNGLKEKKGGDDLDQKIKKFCVGMTHLRNQTAMGKIKLKPEEQALVTIISKGEYKNADNYFQAYWEMPRIKEKISLLRTKLIEQRMLLIKYESQDADNQTKSKHNVALAKQVREILLKKEMDVGEKIKTIKSILKKIYKQSGADFGAGFVSIAELDTQLIAMMDDIQVTLNLLANQEKEWHKLNNAMLDSDQKVEMSPQPDSIERLKSNSAPNLVKSKSRRNVLKKEKKIAEVTSFKDVIIDKVQKRRASPGMTDSPRHDSPRSLHKKSVSINDVIKVAQAELKAENQEVKLPPIAEEAVGMLAAASLFSVQRSEVCHLATRIETKADEIREIKKMQSVPSLSLFSAPTSQNKDAKRSMPRQRSITLPDIFQSAPNTQESDSLSASHVAEEDVVKAVLNATQRTRSASITETSLTGLIARFDSTDKLQRSSTAPNEDILRISSAKVVQQNLLLFKKKIEEEKTKDVYVSPRGKTQASPLRSAKSETLNRPSDEIGLLTPRSASSYK